MRIFSSVCCSRGLAELNLVHIAAAIVLSLSNRAGLLLQSGLLSIYMCFKGLVARALCFIR